jgi:hypothetical protein
MELVVVSLHDVCKTSAFVNMYIPYVKIIILSIDTFAWV